MGASRHGRSIKTDPKTQHHDGADLTTAAARRWRRAGSTAVLTGWLVLTACLAAAAGGDQQDHRRDGTAYDRWGRVVFSPTEGRHSYGQQPPAQGAELPWQRAQHPQTRSVVPHRHAGGKVSTTESPLDVAWTYRELLGANLATGGLTIADIDNDGLLEIIAGTSAEDFGINDTLVALELSPDGGYQVSWMLGPVGEISSVLAGDSDGNGAVEIYVGLRSGEVLVLDGVTRDELTVLDDGSGPATGLLIGDADNDGSDEIVVCHPTETSVYDGATRVLQRRIVHGGDDLALGDVDDDGQLELVLNVGKVIEVQCELGCTYVLEWQLDDGFGDRIALADADADRTAEVIGLSSTAMTAWSAGEETPLWQVPVTADSLAVADVTGDGVAEILYGDREWGAIHCLDAATTLQLWEIDNPKHGVSGLSIADVNRDGELEVIWAAGHSSTEADTLLVADAGDQSIDWQALQTDGGPFAAVAVGDSDDDGDLEILLASTEAAGGYGDGIVHLLEAGTHQLEAASTPASFNGAAWGGITALAIGDVDDDTETEVVVTTSSYHRGAIFRLDGGTLQTEWSGVFDCGTVTSVAIGDVDNDGVTELVLGSAAEAQADEGGLIGVLRGSTGAGEWQWTGAQLDSTVADVIDLAIGNLDSDSSLEIVAVRDRLWVLQSGSATPEWQSTDTGYRAVDLADVDGGAGLEIVAARSNGEIVILRYDTGSYVEVARFQASSSAVTAVSGFRSATNEGRVAFVSDGSLAGLDASTGLDLWRSDQLGAAFWPAALATAPIAGDTGTLFLVGSSLRATQYGGVTEPSRLRMQTHATTVSEDGGVVDVVVERLGSSAGAISVDWATVPGSAVSPDDFIHQSASKSWADGVSGGLIAQVPIADDQTAEASERFWVKLANPSGEHLVIEPPFITEVTIEDEDASSLQLSAASYEVTEADGQINIVVSRTGDLGAALTVDLVVSDGTAIAGVDYQVETPQVGGCTWNGPTSTATCSWAAGLGGSRELAITIIDETDDEGDESFSVKLQNPGLGGLLNNPSEAEVTIVNDDHVWITLDKPSFYVNEGEGTGLVMISRLGSSYGSVGVSYQVSSGTATAGVDFTSVSGVVSWSSGELGSRQVDVKILDDQEQEDDEYATITLSNPTNGATLGDHPTGSLWVLDDDSRLVFVEQTEYTVEEDDLDSSIEVTVRRQGDLIQPISVWYQLGAVDDSATADEDYTVSSELIEFWPGASTDRVVSVALIDDATTEGHERLTFKLDSPSGCVLGVNPEATITINDDEWREVQVNETSLSHQRNPAVAIDSSGSFLVAWEHSIYDSHRTDIRLRRYGSDATPLSGELVVFGGNVSSKERDPAVATSTNGSVVVWVSQEDYQDPDTIIYAQRYDSSGTPIQGQYGWFVVNDAGDSTREAPAVAMDSSGRFMVVWQEPNGADLSDIQGRVYNADGTPATNELLINTTVANEQDSAAVAAAPGGGFMVVWECLSESQSCGGYTGDEGIMGRIFNADGSVRTAEIQVTYRVGDQINPSVTARGDTGFFVAWQDDNGGVWDSDAAVFRRGFSSLGLPYGGTDGPQIVNVVTTGDQTSPSISSDAAGNHVVVWESDGQDGSNLGVISRIEGETNELQVNTWTIDDQWQPAVARSALGSFVVVWTSDGQDGSGSGVYALLRPAGAGSKEQATSRRRPRPSVAVTAEPAEQGGAR